MGLSGQQRKELQDALIDAFPDTASLERMLAYELDKNLTAIAGVGNLQEIVFKLIQTANSQGWVEDLVRAAYNSNAGNPRIKAIFQKIENFAYIEDLRYQESTKSEELKYQKTEEERLVKAQKAEYWLSFIPSSRINRKQFLQWFGLGSSGLLAAVVGHGVLKNQSNTPKLVTSVHQKEIGIYKENRILADRREVNLRNFIVEAQFNNPYAGAMHNFTYGFAFHENTSENPNAPKPRSFGITISSEQNKWTFKVGGIVLEDKLSNLNVLDNGSNKLKLTVEGKKADFYVNDKSINSFEIPSEFTNKGDILLISENGIIGKSVKYENLKIWSLDKGAYPKYPF